jgi:phospholipid-binding lipoprotein MlaA
MAALGLSLSACATGPRDASQGDEAGISDPLEPVNRVTLSFNEFLDSILFNPINTAYRAIFPQVVRDGVHNVLENVKSPVYLANELLQGDLEGAGTVVKRFAINTTVGVAGIVDVAAKNGTPYQPEDFGQTLAVWGVGPGPYIVWPILGPSTLRDSVGVVGDIAMDPLYWYATNNDKTGLQWTRFGLTLVDAKDRTRNMMEDLRRNSGDLYTSLQSVYLQRREALINDLDPSKTALPDIE